MITFVVYSAVFFVAWSVVELTRLRLEINRVHREHAAKMEEFEVRISELEEAELSGILDLLLASESAEINEPEMESQEEITE